MTLLFLDWFLNFLHFIIVFSLMLGWIFKRTRKYHRILLGGTTLFWLLLGPLMGKQIGYCPVTDMAWRVRKARGETHLEYGYINYLVERAGFYMSDHTTDIVVGSVFVSIWVATVFFWIRDRKSAQK
jgi:hypothetical protein